MNYIKENIKEFSICNVTLWHNLGYTGRGIKVGNTEKAYVDSPLFGGKVHDIYGDYQYSKSENHHGNQTAHIIHQVAPDADIYCLNMGVNKNKTNIYDTIPLIKNFGISVISSSHYSSMTTTNRQVTDELLQLLDKLVLVCSAGNDSYNGVNGYAEFKEWLSVGAVGFNDLTDKIFYKTYSSRGKELDFTCFSGLFIPHFGKYYGTNWQLEGTSFSAPMLAGMCALVQQFFLANAGRVLGRYEMENFIKDHLIDLGAEGWDEYYGHGLFILPDPREININKYIIPQESDNDTEEYPEPIPIPTDSLTFKEIGTIMSKDDFNKYTNFMMIYENAKKDGNEVAMNYSRDEAQKLLDKYNIEGNYFGGDDSEPEPEIPVEPDPEEPREEVKELIIDISHHQNPANINYDMLAKQIKLAIIRTQYGSLTRDKYYEIHHAEFRKRGVPTACYAWVRGTSIRDMEVEATDFYNRTKGLNPTFWFLDVEEESMSDMRLGIKAYVRKLRELGAKKVGAYIGHHLYKQFNLDLADFQAIWIPHYGVNNGKVSSSPQFSCDIHQFTSVGRLDGYNGNLDLNRLMGTKPLSYFIEAQDAPVPHPNPQPIPDEETELVDIRIKLHDKDITVKGVFEDGINYIPIRFLENMGYKIDWNKGIVEVDYMKGEK